MSKKKLSHDQKRKQKLAARATRTRVQSSLAYTGNKYKTDELSPVFFATETAIHEVSVMTDGQLTDPHVRAGLEKLVVEMNRGPLPPFEDVSKPALDESQYPDVIVWNVRRHWQERFQTASHPGAEKLNGVLRTLLNSIATWGTPSAHSRGYLKFVEGFLRRGGVSVRKISADESEEDARAESAEKDLLVVGRNWCAGDEEAGEAFRDLAEQLVESGEGEMVAEIAQQLIGESTGSGPTTDLSLIAIRAQKRIPPV